MSISWRLISGTKLVYLWNSLTSSKAGYSSVLIVNNTCSTQTYFGTWSSHIFWYSESSHIFQISDEVYVQYLHEILTYSANIGTHLEILHKSASLVLLAAMLLQGLLISTSLSRLEKIVTYRGIVLWPTIQHRTRGGLEYVAGSGDLDNCDCSFIRRWNLWSNGPAIQHTKIG